jgi:hypothetical protein
MIEGWVMCLDAREHLNSGMSSSVMRSLNAGTNTAQICRSARLVVDILDHRYLIARHDRYIRVAIINLHANTHYGASHQAGSLSPLRSGNCNHALAQKVISSINRLLTCAAPTFPYADKQPAGL